MDAFYSLLSMLLERIALGLPVSPEFIYKAMPVIIAAIGQVFISFLIERKYHKNKFTQVGVSLAAALGATGYTVWLLRPYCVGSGAVQEECLDKPGGDLLLAFVVFLVLWGVAFHLLAWHFGKSVMTRQFGANWVKAIDYIYLSLSIVGILRIVLGTAASGAAVLALFAPLILGIAIAIRMTKTSIEIYGWH